MYIRAAKTEAEEAGISTEGMANSVSELREEILSLTGNRVDIMLDDDSFKSTYKIIKELSEVWSSLSETTKSNITELIGGGVRNANIINALMTNMGTAAEVVEKTSNSAGSALNENAIVLESIQGKINVIKAKFEELSQSIISSGFVKNIVDFGSGLLNILLNIGVLIEKLGGLNNILMITAGAIAVIKADAIVSVLGKILAGIVGIIPALKAFILKLIELPLALRIAKADGLGLAAALDLVGISASTAQIAIAALVAVLTIAIICINNYNQKQEEMRRSNIDNAKSAKAEADSIRDLIDQYKRLAEAEKWDETARNQAKSIQDQIAKLVGTQADNLDLVNGKLDEEIKKLDEILLKTAEANTGQLLVAKKDATDNLVDSSYADFTKTDTTIYSSAGWKAHDALQAAMKEIGLEDKYFTGDGFWVYNESADEVLQSYADMIKLQEHLVSNYEKEISTGGNLKAFYDNLSNRINKMRTAVDDYNQALANYQQNEAVKELGNYLKTNDIDSKEAFDNYINGIRNSTEYSESYKAVLIKLATNTFPQFAVSTDKVVDGLNNVTTAAKDFKRALSEVQSLDAGLGLLDKIYADIYNGENFDFGSILNNEEFSAAFGDLGGAYDDFIEIVAGSPDDIDACRGAFNNLATAYLNNSGVLKDVTDETRDATIAMLKQMGVANAAAIVDASLAKNKELLKYATSEYTSLSYDAVLALYKEAEAGSIAKQALAELAVQKFLTEKNTLTTESDIEQLINLSKAANATERSLMRLNEVKEIMVEAEHLLSLYNTFTYYSIIPSSVAETYLQRYNDLVAKANAILKEPIDYSGMVVDFESVSTDADNAKDSIESLYNAAKNGIEELINYRKKMLEQDIENQKDALEAQIDELQDFYDEQREMLEDQYDEEEYLAEQHEKQKAVTDLKGELAMLANDDSAWAQRRKLEIQEELSDAEDELSELEKEHALDVTLDMLDDQQEVQEKQIQEQIDALDAKLNDPHALYNQALSDIRNNTLDLYQAMIEFNRKYGSGNDDDIAEMWGDAYESNEDYREKTGSTYKDIELGNYAGYNNSSASKVSKISETLQYGSRGEAVKILQRALNELGFGNAETESVNGSFGKQTAAAVRAYQTSRGVTATGNVGSKTKLALSKDGYASGTMSATPGTHEVDELGPEYLFISPSDGSRYRIFTGGEKVLNAEATNFLYTFATSGGGIITKMLSGLLGLNNFGGITKPVQAIELHTGDIIVQGNATERTVSEIRRAQRENLDFIIREFNKLNK